MATIQDQVNEFALCLENSQDVTELIDNCIHDVEQCTLSDATDWGRGIDDTLARKITIRFMIAELVREYKAIKKQKKIILPDFK